MSTDGILSLSDKNKLRAGRTFAPDTVETLTGLQSDNTGRPVIESGRALQNLIYEAVRVESVGFDVVQESHGDELSLALRLTWLRGREASLSTSSLFYSCRASTLVSILPLKRASVLCTV